MSSLFGPTIEWAETCSLRVDLFSGQKVTGIKAHAMHEVETPPVETAHASTLLAEARPVYENIALLAYACGRKEAALKVRQKMTGSRRTGIGRRAQG